MRIQNSWLPILTWLPEYRRAWLVGDLLAGAAGWAVLVPLALAYAGLLGVDPVVGLYALPLSLVAYAIFGGSRLFVVGPDAAVVVLAAATVAGVAVAGEEPLPLILALTLLIGALYVALFLLKVGWIADLIPDPVLKGFIEGAIWVTILKQLPALLGLEVELASAEGLAKLAIVVRALPETHLPTALVGLASVTALWLLREFARRLPGPLVVLLVATVLVWLFGLDQAGLAVVGAAGVDAPAFGVLVLPELDQLAGLLTGALAIVVLGYTKSLGALKRAQAAEPGSAPVDPNRELLAIGAANLGAGLGGGYPVAGSLTATAVRIDAGARTQVGNLFAALLSLLTILLLLPVLAHVAHATLAAIVIVALAGLSNLSYFRKLWSVRRWEFVVAVAALAGVLLFDIMPGVMIGLTLAFFKLAHDIHSPIIAVVGRTPSGGFVDMDQRSGATEIPGMLILRQYAPLVFLNARVLSSELKRLALAREGLQVVVLDATASSGIDSTSAEAFRAARAELAGAGIELWVVNAREEGWKVVLATLNAAGASIPPSFESLADAVARFELERRREDVLR
jgi:high affinity sulfate transporter 1